MFKGRKKNGVDNSFKYGYGLLYFCCFILGVIHPKWKPKLFGRVIPNKILLIYFYVTLCISTSVLLDNIWSLYLAMQRKQINAIVHFSVVVLHHILTISRAFTLQYHWKQAFECFSFIDKFVDEQKANKDCRAKLKGRMLRVTMAITVFLIISSCNTGGYMIRLIYRTGLPPFHSNIPRVVARFPWDITALIIFLANPFVYFWIFLMMVTVTSMQMKYLRKQLKGLFNEFHVNKTDDDQLYLAESRADQVHKKINKWIVKHLETLRCTQKMSEIYSITVLIGYAHLIALNMTIIFLTKQNKGQPLSLSFLAMLTMYIMYVMTHCAEDLKDSSERVTDDVLEASWYIFPVSVQKKLLLILTVSMNRPAILQVSEDFYPVTMATYGGVLNVSYSVYTFVQGLD